MKYSFEILEKAVGKGRPRFNTITKTMYTPPATRTFEEKARLSFINKYNIVTDPSYEPFKVKITAIIRPPKSTSKKMTNELNGKPYTKKPDVDNIAKCILDSLNGLVYKDDSQVTELIIKKEYGIESKVIVELEEL